MMRLVLLLLAPFAVMAAAWIPLAVLRVLPPDLMAAAVPYGTVAIAAAACWRFRRSRAVPVLVLAALTCWFAAWFPQGLTTAPLSRVLYPAFALFLPVNVLLASLVGDRGVFNTKGLGQVALYAAQAALVLFAATGAFGAYDPQPAHDLLAQLDGWLHWRILPAVWDAWTPLPQPALLAGAAAFIILILRAAVRDSPMDAGLAAALTGMYGALHSIGGITVPGAWITGAALAVAAPLFQESYRMAFLDELTGLPARRALMSDFNGLSGRYAVAMADVDHFKKFNDTYGHDVGDEVLRMVASHLGAVGGGGRAYRYGGEEFTLLFPRKTAEEAFEHADGVREAIENAGFTVRTTQRAPKGKKPKQGSKTVSVTISIGLADHANGDTPAAILKAADKALYKAKKKGRNRVMK